MDDVSEYDFNFAGDALSAHIESLEAIDDEKDGEPDGEDRLVAARNEANVFDVTIPEERDNLIEYFQKFQLHEGQLFLEALKKFPIANTKFGRGHATKNIVIALKATNHLQESFRGTASRMNLQEKGLFSGNNCNVCLIYTNL
jgi:hypothetical protein